MKTMKLNIYRTIMLVMACCFFATITNAQNIAIGTRTGASATNSLIYTSTSTTIKYSRSVAIYQASEIIAAGGYAGRIYKLYWLKEGAGEYTNGNANIQVYMKHIPASQNIHAASVAWATEVTGATSVYSNSAFSIPTGTGWKELELSTPFDWNGTDNIEIFIDWGKPTNMTPDMTWAYGTLANSNAFVTGTAVPTAAAARNGNRPLLQLELVNLTATDASLNAITKPDSNIVGGVNDIIVNVKNQGGIDLNSIDIDVEINGSVQPTINHTFSTPLASMGSTSINLGSYNLPTGNYPIRVWTKNPNGIVDADPKNDTLTLNLANDIALAAVVSPDTIVNSGTNPFVVNVKNQREFVLNTVDFEVEIDGVVQPIINHTFSSPLQTSISASVNLGNYNLPFGTHSVRIWTKNPNGLADNNRTNDTLSLTVIAKSLMSGTYTIDPSLPNSTTNFSTFKAAVNTINASGLSSTVYFDVAANAVFNENYILLTRSGTATDSIVFRKAGVGANPLIIAPPGISTSRDFIFGLEGADYVVIDGVDLKDPNTSSTATMNEWGYAFFIKSATDGCQYNTIRNCRIEMSPQTRTTFPNTAIYSINQNATVSTTIAATSMAGTNSYNKFYNDSMVSCMIGISLNGTNNELYYDHGNRIGTDGGNVMINFVASSSNSEGIFVNYQDDIDISNNIINSGPLASGSFWGIETANGLNSNVDINNNTITIRPASGTPMAIRNAMGKNGVNNTLNINNNIIRNCYLGSGTTEFALISNDAAVKTVNISYNIIENDSSNSTGTLLAIKNGFSAQGNPVCTSNVHHNIIRNIKRVALGTSGCAGINNAPLINGCVSNIYDNTIDSLSDNGGSTAATLSFSGIQLSGATTANVYRNTVSNITVKGASGRAIGINFFSSSSTGLNSYIYNNFVHSISAPNSSSADATVGISVSLSSSSSTSFGGVYNNTVYLDDSVVAASNTYGSAGILLNTVTPAELRNNIVINKSVPGQSGGFVTALKRTTTSLASYSENSNNNLFYVNQYGNRRYIYYDGTDSAITLGAFKNKMVTRDQGSIGILPNFVNTTTAPYDLHIDAAIPTPVEATGLPVTTPVEILTDFDNDVRNTLTPDIGADEGNFIPGDYEGPAMAYQKLLNTSNTANRTIVVSITDPAGVDVSMSGRPLLYYRKNSGAYISAPAISHVGNNFTFEINYTSLGGASVGDVFDYYFAAQDLSNPINGSTNPEGGSGTFPPGFTAPAVPETYTIITPLNGTHYVGTTPHSPSASYATLKDALLDYKEKGMNGTLEFVLIDPEYNTTTGETFPLIIEQNPDASATNTLTIKPETGVNVTIEGISAIGSSIIKMNACDYVTINGINANNTSLTIKNATVLTDLATNNAVVWISSTSGNGANYNTVKNCNLLGVSPTQTRSIIFVGTAIGTGYNLFVETNSNGNVIDSNFISKAQYGIILMGSSTVSPALGNKITRNKFGSPVTGDGFFIQGIYVNRQDSALVFANDIQNVVGSGTGGTFEHMTGLGLVNCRNTTVSSNSIHGLRFSGGNAVRLIALSTTAFAYKSVDNPSNNMLVNNAVYDITHTYRAVDITISGINLSDGYGDKVYYNTVSLAGQLGDGSGLGPSAAFTGGYSSIPGNTPVSGFNMDIRNNIFAVTGNYGGGTTSQEMYIYYSKATDSLKNCILDNNIYYLNTPGVSSYIGKLAAYAGPDIATIADWRTTTSGDANSLQINPLLNSPTVLVPQPSSPALNAGVVIPTVTNDIIGTVRNATTPTIGAYEVAGDFRGPDITIDSLKNTTLTTNYNAVNSATITDGGGVNVLTGTRPRLYFKNPGNLNTYNGNTASDDGWKWVEATNTTSPFSFTIDYTLLNTASVNIGDTIQYFIVAQDLSVNTNVGSSAGLFTQSNSVDLTGANFPAQNYYSYRILPATNGYVYVGTGQSYTSLTNTDGLFEALKHTMILTGDVTAIVTSDLTETGTFDLSKWQEEGAGNYRLAIRADQTLTTRLITGNVANGLIRLNGVSKVLIDGMDTNTVSGKYLGFVNQSTTGPVFSFTNGAQFDTLRNCLIEGANTSSSTTSSGLVFIGASTTGGNNFNVIQGNQITGATTARYYNAIYSNGNASNKNHSNAIIGNTISNFSNDGVAITGNNGNNWTISQNHIFDNLVATATTAQVGIEFLAISQNNTISNNTIGGKDATAGNGKWSSSGNNSFIGITASFDSTGSNTITGNIIRNIERTNTGTSTLFTGIRVSRGTVVVSNNIIGDTLDAGDGITCGGAAVSHGIEITNSIANANIVVQNNYVANISTLGTTAANRLRGIGYNNTSTTNTIPVTIKGNQIFNLSSLSQAVGFGAGEQSVTGIYCNPNSSGTNFADVTVSNNQIYNMIAYAAADVPTVAVGVFLNNVKGTVNANRIHRIRNYSSRNLASNPAISTGILLRASNQIIVSNNMITAGYDTTDNIQYIGIWNPYSSLGAKLYHNTVVVRGTHNGDVSSFAMFRGNNNTTDFINSEWNGNNNILFNDRSANKAYAIGNNSAVSANGFGVQSWNNNLLYAQNVDMGYWNGTAIDFNAWKTNSTKDQASVSKYVWFNDITIADLHLTAPSVGDLGLAGVATIIDKDFDDETRNAVPYMGADEDPLNPVPVKLVSFNAFAQNKDVLVTWNTASEENASHFVIEASVNGKEFTAVGKVKAQGNTTTTTNYGFNHNNAQVAMGNVNQVYYRLVSVDFNGTSETSKIVAVDFTKSNRELDALVAYPNPFNDKVYLNFVAEGNGAARIEVKDITGKTVASYAENVIAGNNVLHVDGLQVLNTGLYFVSIEHKGAIQVTKMIKQ